MNPNHPSNPAVDLSRLMFTHQAILELAAAVSKLAGNVDVLETLLKIPEGEVLSLDGKPLTDLQKKNGVDRIKAVISFLSKMVEIDKSILGNSEAEKLKAERLKELDRMFGDLKS